MKTCAAFLKLILQDTCYYLHGLGKEPDLEVPTIFQVTCLLNEKYRARVLCTQLAFIACLLSEISY